MFGSKLNKQNLNLKGEAGYQEIAYVQTLWRIIHNLLIIWLSPSGDCHILKSCNFLISCRILIKFSLIYFHFIIYNRNKLVFRVWDSFKVLKDKIFQASTLHERGFSQLSRRNWIISKTHPTVLKKQSLLLWFGHRVGKISIIPRGSEERWKKIDHEMRQIQCYLILPTNMALSCYDGCVNLFFSKRIFSFC